MSDRRRVMVSKLKYNSKEKQSYINQEFKEADFVQYCQDYEEYREGPGLYPAAIVEYDDGTVGSVHVNLIRFL